MDSPDDEIKEYPSELAAAVNHVKNTHPAIAHVLQYFEYEHLPLNLRIVSEEVHALAWFLASQLPENPETTAGLRKLLEAKDCFVRAMLSKE